MAISLGKGAQAWPWRPWLEALAEAEVDALQVREKTLQDGELFRVVQAAVDILAGRCLVLVNGRADIALAAGAHGVHLPATGLPAEALRCHRGFGSLLIGRSAHGADDVDRARREGCDYVLFGPVKPTPSKPEQTHLPGFEGMRQASRQALPVLALGGIEAPDDLDLAAEAGAFGVAGIRAFADSRSAAAITRHARRLWPRATSEAP